MTISIGNFWFLFDAALAIEIILIHAESFGNFVVYQIPYHTMHSFTHSTLIITQYYFYYNN